MVDSVKPEPTDEQLKDIKNVIDATYTCTQMIDEGGQSHVWFGEDGLANSFAVKVFKKIPGAHDYEEEVKMYNDLWA